MTRNASYATALVALCLAAAPAAAVPPSEGTLDADLDAARKLVQDRQWQAGIDAVKAVFEEHKDDPEARPRFAEMEDVLRRSAFGLSGWTLDPVKTIGRGAVKYTASTRAIEIAVDPAKATSAEGGWKRHADGDFVLDLPFDGDVTVELPWRDAGDWGVLLSWDTLGGTGWCVEPKAQDHSGGPGRITRHDEESKVLGPVAAPRAKEPTTVRVVRAGSTIVVWGDKSQLAQEVAVGDRTGCIGLRPSIDVGSSEETPRLPAARITGKLASGAARKLLAGAEDRALREWTAKSWHRADALPKWVLELEAASGAWATRIPEVPEASRVVVQEAVTAFYAGDVATLRARTAALAEVEVSEPTRDFIDGLQASAEGHAAESEAALRKASSADPKSGAAAAALAQVLRWSRGEDVAFDAAGAALAIDPAYAPALDIRAEIQFARGDLDGMRATLDAAAKAATASRRTAELREVLRLARRRPAWKKPGERAGERFAIAFDGDASRGTAFEKALDAIRVEFEKSVRMTPAATRFRVVLVSDAALWEAWGAERGVEAEGREAVYVPHLRELLVRDPGGPVGDDPAARAALRSGAFRALLHRSVADAPPWLDRGAATAFGALGAPTRPVKKEGAGEAAMSALRESTLLARFSRRFVPVADLLTADAATFEANVDVLTIQSRAVARALLAPQDPSLKGVLAKYVDALASGRGQDVAFHDVLEPVLPAIEAAAGRSGPPRK
ncbi:MAG: hypothetical protein K8T90_22070 [Planctomycetes bacterium]|nr:hypothetical protein [Planctomycetota bacterium]